MKKVIYAAATVLLIALGVGGGYWLGQRNTEGEKEAGREILYWQAPMNPEEIYDAPGKSAMGMDLVPVYADEVIPADTTSGAVVPATTQRMNVRVAPVERMNLARMIRTIGEVAYDEERLHIVNIKVDAWIERLYVNDVGERVQQGAPLMDIYAPELVSSQHEYLLALTNYEALMLASVDAVRKDAEDLLRAARERLDTWDFPAAEIDRLTETRTVNRTVTLEAPASGVVVERHVLTGAHVTAGTDLFEIADLSTAWVHASLFDNELPWIRVGQPVQMELSYLPGKTYAGRVSFIYPFLREEARDAHVRLIFENPDRALFPGMYANITLEGATIPDVVAVPREAIIHSGTRTLVFVERDNGQHEPRDVLLGMEGGPANQYVEVRHGLEEGEQVVISGQFLLSSESRLQEALNKMLPPESPTGSDMDHSNHD